MLESNTIDEGCYYEGKLYGLWISSNYIVAIMTENPDYWDYVEETGDDSGDKRFITTYCDFRDH